MVDTDDTRRTIHDGRRTTPRVWHKLPTGELKIVRLSWVSKKKFDQEGKIIAPPPTYQMVSPLVPKIIGGE